MPERLHALGACMPGRGPTAKLFQQCSDALEALAHAWIFRLPHTVELIDDELRVAADIELYTARVFSTPHDRLQCLQQCVVLGLVIGVLFAKLEALRWFRLATDGKLVRAVATTGIADAAAVENQCDREQGFPNGILVGRGRVSV